MRILIGKDLWKKVVSAVGMAVGLFLLSGTLQSAQAQSCTYWASPTGSDSNPGTSTQPWQTVQKAFDTATAGQTVCFYGGTYAQNTNSNTCKDFTEAYSQCEVTSGTAANPITFTNVSGQVAVIQGSTRIDASYITVYGTPNMTTNCASGDTCGLVFEGNQVTPTDNIDVCCVGGANPQFVKFDHVEIKNGTYHAGFYEEGCNNTLTGSYIHDNGRTNRDTDNGVYWSRQTTDGCSGAGTGGLIANNVVESNYSKGIQLFYNSSTTNPQNVVVEENTSVNNGEYGLAVWGKNNVLANNILYNDGDPTGKDQGVIDTAGPQTIDHNITWDTTSSSRAGWFDSGRCGCVTNNLGKDPSFVSPSTLNWHILGSSPAVGFSNQSYVQTVDHDGVVRSNPADTGAYQH